MIKKKLIEEIITIIKDYINEPDVIITCIKISTDLLKKKKILIWIQNYYHLRKKILKSQKI